MNRLLARIATLHPIGTLPMPGTAASLVALIAGVIILKLGGAIALTFATGGAVMLGFGAVGAHYRITGIHDAAEVVIDELIGQWLALLAVAIIFDAQISGQFSNYFSDFWIAVGASFVLFRLFDISKPGLIGAAEDLPAAAGVIADDVLAGILAGMVLMVIAPFAGWGG